MSAIANAADPDGFAVGDEVDIPQDMHGVIRYIGKLPRRGDDLYLGVDLAPAFEEQGRTDGIFYGERMFQASGPKAAAFALAARCRKRAQSPSAGKRKSQVGDNDAEEPIAKRPSLGDDTEIAIEVAAVEEEQVEQPAHHPGTSALQELGRLLSGSISSRCNEYITAGLGEEADGVAELLLRPVKANGVGNEWYCAEPLEQYMPDLQEDPLGHGVQEPLDPDVSWTPYWHSPDGGGALQAWSDVKPSDDDLDLHGDGTIQTLETLGDWIADLRLTSRHAGTEVIIFPAVRDVTQMSFPDFVRGPLLEEAVQDATAQLRSLWDPRFEAEQPNPLHCSSWQALYDDMMARMTTHGELPAIPQAYEYTHA